MDKLDMPSLPEQEWKALIITFTLLLFSLALRSDRIQKRLEQGYDLQTMLTNQGCLACGHYRAYLFVVRMIKSKGLWHCSQVADGLIEDPAFKEFR